MKTDGWIRRFTAIFIARPLYAMGVRRMQVIVVRYTLGLLAALTMAISPVWFSAAAVLFAVGLLLERADGELAELEASSSVETDRHAFLSASLSSALAFVGLGIGMRVSEYGLTAIGIGLLAAIAVTALSWLVKRLEFIDGERSAELGGIAGFDADDMLFLFPVALWAGWAEGLLLVSAFGVTTFVCALYATHYRKFKSR